MIVLQLLAVPSHAHVSAEMEERVRLVLRIQVGLSFLLFRILVNVMK